MADLRSDAEPAAPSDDVPAQSGDRPAQSGDARARPRRRVAIFVVLLVVAIGAVALAGGWLTSRPGGAAGAGATTALSTGLPSPIASSSAGASPAPGVSPSPVASGPAGPGLIAVVDDSGALTTLDDRGGSRVTYRVPGVVLGFPAWSPDGTRIASVGQGPDDSAIYVFTVSRTPGAGGQPTIVYRSSDRPPFYLYWTPDSRRVSFLTTDTNGLALRVAPVDRATPIDQNDPAFVLRRGAPLYFDWIDGGRVLLHVGDPSNFFVGTVGLDGTPVGSTVAGNGFFRTASLSHDGRYEAYATSTTIDSGAIVVGTPGGKASHPVPAYGPVAMLFDPSGDRLATIAADKPGSRLLGFPLGPLRLIDPASGSVRTILDGSVIAFFWSPDGRTIAALRVVTAGQGPTAATGGLELAAVQIPGPGSGAGGGQAPGSNVDLAFVDPATGAIRSERTVPLSDRFVADLLPYFDQYALSHTIWSPDGSSVLLPIVDPSGQGQIMAVPVDGTAARPVTGGTGAFWSP